VGRAVPTKSKTRTDFLPTQQLLIENETEKTPLTPGFSSMEDGWKEISESACKHVKRREVKN
jgi:hypothetical protein